MFEPGVEVWAWTAAGLDDAGEGMLDRGTGGGRLADAGEGTAVA